MAGIAHSVIGHNSLLDKCSLINEYSCDVTVGEAPLERRVDVVVAEVFGDDPLNEGVIKTIEHARANLLVPGGRVVPAEVRVIAAVAHSQELMDLFHVSRVGPLDISPMNDLSKIRQYLRLQSYDYELLTEPLEIIRIPLEGDGFRTNDFNYEEMTALRDGKAQFVLVWYELCFSGEQGSPCEEDCVKYSTASSEEKYPWQRAWNQVCVHAIYPIG